MFIFSEILSKYDYFAYDMVQDDNKKAELLNDYFCKQADLNDTETSVPDITDILINGLEQITVTENEVEDILKILDTSKAIGFIFSDILSKYDCFAFNISLLHLLRIFRNFPHCPIVLVFFAFL
jgi:uncharacterized protein YutD